MVVGPTLLRFRLAGLLILAIALPADVCPQATRADSLSELPQLDTRNFLPAVRDQVQRAYQAALRNPKAAEATGELGMVLDAYEQYRLGDDLLSARTCSGCPSFRWLYYLGWVQSAQGKHQDAVAEAARIVAHEGRLCAGTVEARR